MITNHKLCTLVATLALSLGLTLSATAAPLLSVDIGSGPVKAGFSGYSTFPPVPEVYGSYTVTLGGPVTNIIDVTVPDGQDLMRDFAYSLSDPMTLTVSGLAANTSYSFTGWSWQTVVPMDVIISADTGTTGGSLSIVNDGSNSLTDNSPEIQATGTFTTNGSGVLSLLISKDTDAPNGPRFNGFTLSAVPEPSSFMIGAIGCAAVAVIRRRRR